MLKSALFTSCLFLSGQISADTFIDLYGDNSNHANQVLKKYSSEVKKLINNTNEIILMNDAKKQERELLNLAMKKKYLVERIKKNEHYAFVDFQTIYYPAERNYYTTIEVVRHDEKHRLHYIQQKINVSTNKTNQNDLIEQRIKFDKLEMHLLNENKLGPTDAICPVYHCVSGFNNPALQPYLKVFNEGAIKQKKLIKKTLSDDPNPERRAAAAFLVGHFKDPKEIIATLTSSINDRSEAVRNNVMRVMGQTIEKSHLFDIDANKVLPLIDSPYTTDRNKALFILSSAVKSEKNKKIILEKGKKRIVDILRLKQPNNHEFAYLILKEISGKNYSDTDIQSWQNWLNTVKV
ncbi:HEAT repeat domain-containing protein [Legionella gresilensis]|uniref:HEAT repeat domain-containing protein n=1 Tax=Legionella gresilensis TaxID=91823 RepID=UPI001041918A|nr:HEAT repeat domain-containing protein [Legionella gresilensis]